MKGPERAVEERDVSETEPGMEVDVEDEDGYINACVADVGVSGYECEGFTLSEILRRKRLSKRSASEGVADIFLLPQREFANLQNLPLCLLLENPCWPVIDSCWASCAARSETCRQLRETVGFQRLILENLWFVQIIQSFSYIRLVTNSRLPRRLRRTRLRKMRNSSQ